MYNILKERIRKMDAQIEAVKEAGKKLKVILGLSTSPVGVRLIVHPEPISKQAIRLQQHRYCQALMKARHGEKVVLDAEGIACPAAAAAFGFRALPEGLKSGQGLVGFGIVSDPLVGKTMFANMPTLTLGALIRLSLFPLEQAEEVPDIIVIEDEVEKLMWINLAYLHATGGERVQGSTAILQATCVDSTIIPFLENRLNFGMGCYGCREATDLGPNETVVGFPIVMLEKIVDHIIFLGQKAIPNSRKKKIYESLGSR
jgi:uncharacterized protein (DUF169 family)